MVGVQKRLSVARVVYTVVLLQKAKDEGLDFIGAKTAALARRNSGGGLHIKSNGWGQVLTIQFEKPGKPLPHSTSMGTKNQEQESYNHKPQRTHRRPRSIH